ncbi:hypothetical protein MNEG_5284 [Monoraphidium neglectum]|uniref:BTB domain-containing protein n=1 Tax=Monoraphidium neglectum TaxID=145388 RepID=A0A0D2JV59_9CHLO|nr:hypothetical protein MNEG_5284 [Monoraphidium neglectum]KIZ02678.1 hypothetical protein MNEG_5284 [Monoraphidium neglectum]|eukprot:XP_013901697.1 hypothetical protein MNEG_5284 [Monoraphidium neglectum]
MLSGDAFVESRTAEVTLQEAEPAAVDLLLSHMYGGAIDVPLPLVPQLYGLADQYQVRSDLAGQLLAWLAAARLVPGALCGMLPAAHRLCARACEASLYAQAAAALGQVCRLPGFACWPLELVQAVARRAPFGEALGAVAAWMKAHEQRQQEEEQTYQQRPQKDAQPPEQQRQERQQEGVAAEEACDQGEQEQGSRPHDDERRRERLDCWRRERLDCWRQLLGSFDSSKATLEDLRGVRQLLGEGGGGSSSAGSPVGGGSGGSGGFGDGGGGEVPGLREWLLDAYDGLCGRQQLQLEGRRVRTPQPR